MKNENQFEFCSVLCFDVQQCKHYTVELDFIFHEQFV